ncbi:MAG: DinB family protein [Candidatus Methylomirabilia bacterium]
MNRQNARCPICRGPHTLLEGNPVSVLRRSPAALSRQLRRSRKGSHSRRPARRQWSVNEILSHLADAEIAFAFRLRKMAAEPNPTLTSWDQEAWAEALRYRTSDPQAALAAFQAFRRSNLDVLGRLSPAQRKRAGRHPEYGRLRIDQLVAHHANHDLNHLKQVRTALQTLSRRRSG